jgi:NADPH-dependent 2,4-dienoyl-CoA reductase/sulfur reductase-like enzyme
MNAQDFRLEHWDLAVVGAGPAGLAAATLAAGQGARTLLLDENPTPGGQIYRGIEATPFAAPNDPLGADYHDGAALARAFRASGATHEPGATVWSLTREREIGVSRGGVARLISADRVILATGAVERPLPIPGWTLPGVMGAGGAQTLLKASGMAPGGRVVLAGSGPLLWLLAWQYLRAGVKIDAVLDATPRDNWRAALPHLPGFLRSSYLAKGLKLLLAVRRRVRVIGGVTAMAAVGDDRLQAVEYQAGGRAGRIEADTLLLHHGVIPNLNLAVSAGCATRWDEQGRAFAIDVDDWGATSVPGVAVAGDGAWIGGALAAAERGRLAALDALAGLGRIDAAARDRMAAPCRAALDRALAGRAFVDALYRPAPAFVNPADAVIVCRCEEVTAGQIRQAAAAGCSGPNQAKSFLRCGMGPCQGRMCGATVTEVLADALNRAPAEIGHYRLRAPVKPITLAELASLPTREDERAAIEKSH